MQLKQIGIVHSNYKTPGETPKRSEDAGEEATIELYPEYVDGLKDLEGFSHAYVICYLDRVKGTSNFAYPPQDGNKRGVFATRSPHRPNPISLTRVRIKDMKDSKIKVEGLDITDKTPLIDIKPYTGRIPGKASFGWLEQYLGD
ncbi:MAG: tRNA (N6-threonylcarbamoyladenosine(37)-N6)-methyltransferase TrmO [Nanoarchaeota archaeon]